MSEQLAIRLRYFGVICGCSTFVFWLIGFGGFAQWIPPLEPVANADQVAEHYKNNALGIRIGMIFVLFGAAAYLPWTLLLTEYVRRIEGNAIFLSGIQFCGGLMSQMTFFIPAFIWAVASFRPERDPMVVQGISDIAWIIFITGWPPFALQYLSLAVAIFCDNRAKPGFPRWAGYLQFLITISFIPASLALFFKNGPFAWNGIFVWWIPLTIFAIWFFVMAPLAWMMVKREAAAGTFAPSR